jgi:glycosyltransferase involved in cell wall biosynthesis
MRCLIVIPTYNRATTLKPAIEAALGQSHAGVDVVVIDDGSTDATRNLCAAFAGEPHFAAVHLARNVGTARAKNVALALLPFDAVTFHDSDDLPDRDKLARQARVMMRQDLLADPCLNWPDDRAGKAVAIDVVLTGHRHIAADGSESRIARALSLVDDFFPNLQFNSGPLGDWVLVNSGLFRRDAWVRVGGYADLVEEDRELRNRLLLHGCNVWLIPDPLLTKFESADSLTVRGDTGYRSGRRRRDRAEVWARIAEWRRSGRAGVEPIDLAGVAIAGVTGAPTLAVAPDLPMTAETRRHLEGELARIAGSERAVAA